ncbi:hypothetical protein HanRHA438_Chr09g0395181 [Helianthus annuus]|nr:hypothetical protein HanRHA438_Chr09g0395181 [Helianthus annuus]
MMRLQTHRSSFIDRHTEAKMAKICCSLLISAVFTSSWYHSHIKVVPAKPNKIHLAT